MKNNMIVLGHADVATVNGGIGYILGSGSLSDAKLITVMDVVL